MGKAIFLDRDGVINIDKGYVHRVEDFEFVKGIFKTCRILESLGYLIFIVTNQSGIARNYYTLEDYYHLTKWMIGKFKENKVHISKVYFCPSHPFSDCPRRKPNPGMIFEAQNEFDVDLSLSILIGDKPTDILAAKRAGIGTILQIETNSRIDLEWLLKRIR